MKTKINLTKAGKITIAISSVMAVVFIVIGILFGVGAFNPIPTLKQGETNTFEVPETGAYYEYILDIQSYGSYSIAISGGKISSIKDSDDVFQTYTKTSDSTSDVNSYKISYIDEGKYVLRIKATSSYVSIYYTYYYN